MKIYRDSIVNFLWILKNIENQILLHNYPIGIVKIDINLTKTLFYLKLYRKKIRVEIKLLEKYKVS